MDTIEFLYSIIGTPLGYILWAIYEVICKNTGASIGVAILVFTFIVKLAMLPLAIKQQKNSARSAIFAPKVREIQQKYKNNQEKQQQEIAKLQKQGYSPMGGCGTMAITFLLLFGVLDVVYKPMTHIKHMQNTTAIMQESYYVSMTKIFVDEYSNTAELEGEALTKHEDIVRDAKQILEYYNANCLKDGEEPAAEEVWNKLDSTSKDIMKKVITSSTVAASKADGDKEKSFSDSDLYSITKAEQEELDKIGDETQKTEYTNAHSFSKSTKSAIETVQRQFGTVKGTSSSESLTYTQASTLQRELYAINRYGEVEATGDTSAYSFGSADTQIKAELNELNDKLEFLGIPLGKDPASDLGWPMILIPILAFVFSMAQTLISNKTMEMNSPGTNTGCMKGTMFIMPIFSVVLVFTVPAGAGFYWTISYLFGILQTLLLNKLYNPAKLRAEAEAEYNERMKQEAKDEKKKRQAADLEAVQEYEGEKLTQKEINRRKLAEARKADAEKYGEEYHEDDEDDT